MRDEETKGEKTFFLFLVFLCIVAGYCVIGMWYGTDTVNEYFKEEIINFHKGTVFKGEKLRWKDLCNVYGKTIECYKEIENGDGIFDQRRLEMLEKGKTVEQDGFFVFAFSSNLRGSIQESIYCESASYVALDLLWLPNWLHEKKQKKRKEEESYIGAQK